MYYYHTIDTYTGLLVPEGIIHYYHTIDTYTGLLVPEGIIHTVVKTLLPTWCIRYIAV
jgi:hypothetical protein